MNILLEAGLPEEIDGVPISPDFRNMIRFELVLQEKDLSESERLYLGLTQLWPEIPQDVDDAIRKLMWFYGCGRSEPAQKVRPAREIPRAYDFGKDAEMIYAGFYAAYGVSLTTLDFMHWWEFMALLMGLPDTTQMGRIMYYRTVDLAQIKDKAQRDFLAEQQKYWALDPLLPSPRRTAQEIEQATLERARRRSAEVRRMMMEQS